MIWGTDILAADFQSHLSILIQVNHVFLLVKPLKHIAWLCTFKKKSTKYILPTLPACHDANSIK
jgi:hypothetical protein